jgi:excisionase family DNA binding protein
MEDDKVFQPLVRAASRLGVPTPWLRRQADEGRIPCLKIGRRILVDIDVLTRLLEDRAASACASAVPMGV